MITLLAAAAPGVTQTWLPTGLSAVATIVVGYMVFRNARRANRISERSELSRQQLAWTQQAMTEAQAAKAEARSATEAAGAAERAAAAATRAAESATNRAQAAEARLLEVQETADRLMGWIGRVVRKAHEVDADASTPADVVELLRVINGGPPEVSASRIRRAR